MRLLFSLRGCRDEESKGSWSEQVEWAVVSVCAFPSSSSSSAGGREQRGETLIQFHLVLLADKLRERPLGSSLTSIPFRSYFPACYGLLYGFSRSELFIIINPARSAKCFSRVSPCLNHDILPWNSCSSLAPINHFVDKASAMSLRYIFSVNYLFSKLCFYGYLKGPIEHT